MYYALIANGGMEGVYRNLPAAKRRQHELQSWRVVWNPTIYPVASADDLPLELHQQRCYPEVQRRISSHQFGARK